MVFFIELLFFVVALAVIVLGEIFGAHVALAVALVVLVISFVLRLRYARSVAALPGPAQTVGEAGREAREEILFREELLRSWRHFNLLILLGSPFLLGWWWLSR